MKKLNFTLLIAFLAGLLGFAACNTEDVEPNLAEINVTGIPEGGIINLPITQGSFELQVQSNRLWRVEGTTDWLVASPESGEGNGTIRFSYGPNNYLQRETVIRIATTTLSQQVRVIQEGAVDSNTLYFETFGVAAQGTQTVANYTGWVTTGLGANNVTYSSEGGTVDVRTSLASSFPDASGGANLMASAANGGTFFINNIETLGMTEFHFSTGYNCAVEGMTLSYRTTGDWEQIHAFAVTSTWVYSPTIAFTIPEPSTTISFRIIFPPTEFGSRIDDPRLVGIGTIAPTPQVETVDATDVTETTAIVGGSYTLPDGAPDVTAVGVSWKKSSDPETAWTETAAPGVATPFTVTLGTTTALESGTRYDFRAYVVAGGQTYYGAIRNFTTAVAGLIFSDDFGTGATSTGSPAVWPALSAWTAWNMTGTGASGVTYSSEGTGTIDVRSNSPSNENNDPSYVGSGGNNIFMPNGGGDSFVINGIVITGFTNFTISFGFSANNTAKPVVSYSTTGNAPWTEVPVIGDFATTDIRWTLFSGSFAIPAAADRLWLRITSSAYSFGSRIDDLQIIEGPAVIVTPPTVTTTDATAIGDNTATLNGSYVAGTEAVTEVGFSIRSGSGTYEDFPATLGTPFTLVKSDLNAGTMYTYRGYAVTASGKYYGNEVTFNTTGTIPVGTELLVNGSFEDWTDVFPAGWSQQGTTTTTNILTLTKITENPHDGLNAAYIGAVGTTMGLTQTVSITPGDEYTISLWYRDNSKGTTSQGIRPWGTVYNATGGAIAVDGLQPGSTFEAVTEWTEFRFTFTAPDGAATLKLDLRATQGQHGTFDQVSVIKTAGGTPAPVQPTVAMNEVNTGAVTFADADVSGTFTGGNQTVTGAGFEYMTGGGQWQTQNATGTTSPFIATLSGLSANTTYTVRAFVITATSGGKIYSPTPDKTFTTPAAPAGISFGTPTISGTFVAGTQSTDGKITIPYTNAAGTESYTISVISDNAAFTDMTGITKSITTAGSGDIEIDLTAWTPTADGTVIFTISGISGLTTNTVQATVTPGGGTPAPYLSMDFSGATGGAPPFSTSGESGSDFFDTNNAPTSSAITAGFTGWTGSKVYAAQGAIKLGSGSAKGWITTPALSAISGTADVTVSFKVGVRTTDNPSIVVSVTGGGTINGSATITGLSNSAMEERSFTVTGATSSTTITFSAVNASNNRFYLDDIVVQ